MIDKIDQVLNRSIKSLIFKTNRDWGSMVKELAELLQRVIAEKDLDIAILKQLLGKQVADSDKEIAELNAKIIELQNRLRLYEKKAGDAFLNKIP
jgi:hypothetical protein